MNIYYNPNEGALLIIGMKIPNSGSLCKFFLFLKRENLTNFAHVAQLVRAHPW